ncbi:hypothetical protein CON36_34570 [Bacillus cereus]|uniref:Uncharacterized protein n=1 Tax=Bacillus cereus TaxID=1396 RepID=A0A9X6SSB7_BACCE|nr:hypothetical protein [Bacillus cereus]PDZ94288.1 hypothetical protein CON36_34570 [Bacillus cereus]
MIKISGVEEPHLWCHSCFTKNDKDEANLSCISIELPIESDHIDVANFRLCRSCLDELKTKISTVMHNTTSN